MSDGINFAKVLGIHSVAGAIIFAVAYLPLLVWFIRQSFGRPTYVFIVLSLFCAIRTTAFIIRAVLAGSDSAGRDLGLLIGDEVLFGVGFFGLLYSAYTLVMDRGLLSNTRPGTGIASRLTRNRQLFRAIMTAGVVLGIVGSSQSQSSDPNHGSALRTASTIIFLALTVLVAYQTILLAKDELTSGYDRVDGSFGAQHGSYILCAIALLLLVREVFAVATIGNLAKQNNEHLWYPLYALPEIIAVAFYGTPGLVPPRSELPQ